MIKVNPKEAKKKKEQRKPQATKRSWDGASREKDVLLTKDDKNSSKGEQSSDGELPGTCSVLKNVSKRHVSGHSFLQFYYHFLHNLQCLMYQLTHFCEVQSSDKVQHAKSLRYYITSSVSSKFGLKRMELEKVDMELIKKS